MRTVAGVTVTSGGTSYAVLGPIGRGRIITGVFLSSAPGAANQTSVGVTVRGTVESPSADAAGFNASEIIGAVVGGTDEVVFATGSQIYIPLDAVADRFSYLIFRVVEKTALGSQFVAIGVQTGRGSLENDENRGRTVNTL